MQRLALPMARLSSKASAQAFIVTASKNTGVRILRHRGGDRRRPVRVLTMSSSAASSTTRVEKTSRPPSSSPPPLFAAHPSATPSMPPTPQGPGTGRGDASPEPGRRDDWLASEREELLLLAETLTRSLYRSCLVSVRRMASGNDADDANFAQRESKLAEEEADLGGGGGGGFSMTDALVDRENELSSRANYYRQNAREHFEGHWHQFAEADPWMERDPETFLYLLRKGEEQRQWVMKSYEFTDPCEGCFDDSMVDEFEARVNILVRETYRSKGWAHSSDAGMFRGEGGGAVEDEEDSDDEFFDDDEDYESGTNRK